jgi:hypothetical protein
VSFPVALKVPGHLSMEIAPHVGVFLQLAPTIDAGGKLPTLVQTMLVGLWLVMFVMFVVGRAANICRPG